MPAKKTKEPGPAPDGGFNLSDQHLVPGSFQEKLAKRVAELKKEGKWKDGKPVL